MKMSFNKSHTKEMEITEMSFKLNYYLCVAWKMKETKQQKTTQKHTACFTMGIIKRDETYLNCEINYW